MLSSRSLLEGRRPVETMVVRFSSDDGAIVVAAEEGRGNTIDYMMACDQSLLHFYFYSKH